MWSVEKILLERQDSQEIMIDNVLWRILHEKNNGSILNCLDIIQYNLYDNEV